MRKMNFLKTSLKCGVLSSNLLNCSAMECNDKKNQQIKDPQIVERQIKQNSTILIFDLSSCNNVVIDKRINEIRNLEYFAEKSRNLIKNVLNKTDHESIIYYDRTISYKINLNPIEIAGIANENNCCINLGANVGTNFYFSTKYKKLMSDDIKAQIYWKNYVYDLEYGEKQADYDFLNNCYITPCCKTIIKKEDAYKIEENIMEAVYENYKNKAGFDYKGNKLNSREFAVNGSKQMLFLPTTCVFCELSHLNYIGEKKEYLNMFDGSFVILDEFKLNPFYEYLVKNENKMEADKCLNEILFNLKHLKVKNEYSSEGRKNQEKIQMLYDKMVKKFKMNDKQEIKQDKNEISDEFLKRMIKNKKK